MCGPVKMKMRDYMCEPLCSFRISFKLLPSTQCGKQADSDFKRLRAKIFK